MESIKIRNQLPKFNQQTHTILMNDGWKLLREPKNLTTATLLSVPFMFINVMITIGIIYFFQSFSIKEFFVNTGNSITFTINIGLILVIVLFVVIHELLHLIFIPNFIKSKDTYMGLTLFGGYVHTEQILTKARFILISIAPFFILSIFFPFMLGSLGLFTGTLIFLIILNSLGSCIDILAFMLVLVQVPKKAVIINNGTSTYWKLAK
ncbi:MAG: DUF3267 domain-containing protein [Bacillus sp. (in: Bacteria)]|nr:DUF3267 domain-containing protein [Bacillus sp. (in: firmicutes)]